MWLITLNGGDERSLRSLYQLLTLSLWRCRSRRACVRAYIHPHARVCGRVCIHMCRRVYVRVHAYARAPVHAYMRTRMHVHACARVCTDVGSWWRRHSMSSGVLGACTHPCACARVYAWVRMCTTCSECGMHFGIGVLGTSAWAGVYVTQVCFDTSLQVVHVCVYVHMCVYTCVCVWMRVCVYDIA